MNIESRYMVEMHVHSPIFWRKKIRSITVTVWVLGRVEKNVKNIKV